MVQKQAGDGLHIIIEGIDGSGKSTVLNACRTWAEAQGVAFFDVIAFTEQQHRLPDHDDIGNATGLITAEPSFCWIGQAIREEIIAKHLPPPQTPPPAGGASEARYDGWETAQAFALDRLVLFRRLIIPFLQGHPDRVVIQDRSLASSLAYQPLQDTGLTTEKLLALPGNAQTLAFAPDLLILIRTEAAAAMARLAHRTDKQDNHIFEQSDFQQKLVQRYLSDDVLGPFRQAGTKLAEIDGNQPIPDVAAAVQSALSQNLPDFARLSS